MVFFTSTAAATSPSWHRRAVTWGVSVAAVCCASNRTNLMASAWTSSPTISTRTMTVSTALDMARTRGLEQRREGATPTEGGMTLYLKAAEDGVSVGDCPFAHAVRLVLEEKGLEYELKPSTADTKPNWLIEHYEGKMPALRHRKECYTESGVIADYLDFFFTEPSLKPKASSNDDAEAVLEGFFPAVAQYLKTMEGDDAEQLENLQTKLAALNDHLAKNPSSFLDGSSDDAVSLLDCRLVPQLYHLQVGLEGFKSGIPNLSEDYSQVDAYFQRCAARPSFAATVYPKETVLWGWGNARK